MYVEFAIVDLELENIDFPIAFNRFQTSVLEDCS
jgi:hypothetical protein